MTTATKTKLPTGTLVKGARHPITGKPLYLTGAGAVRAGKAGSKDSYVMGKDEVVACLCRLGKSDRRSLRKALHRAGNVRLAATDVRNPR